MTYEAVLRDKVDEAIDFTIADNAGIEKGTLCNLADPRTAAASGTEGEVCSGIAAREKIASDGRTRLAIFRRGIFDVYASGAIAVGSPVKSAGAVNKVKSAVASSLSGAAIIGYALETAADNEQFQIFLDVGAGGAANAA